MGNCVNKLLTSDQALTSFHVGIADPLGEDPGVVQPAKGDRICAISYASLQEGDPIVETFGFMGVPLCTLGRLYIWGGGIGVELGDRMA